jgi:hypothetical protein
MFAQFDWLHLIAYFAGGITGLFLCAIMTSGKVSDLQKEAEYYQRMAERPKAD